jgi:hypothetical protein
MTSVLLTSHDTLFGAGQQLLCLTFGSGGDGGGGRGARESKECSEGLHLEVLRGDA